MIQNTSSPSTYNPQERTFIKKPENKICAACGQPIQESVKPMSNFMNSYIANSSGAKSMIINSNEETLTVGGVVVYKIDSKTGQATFPKPIVQTPVVPPAPPTGNTVITPKPVIQAPTTPVVTPTPTPTA